MHICTATVAFAYHILVFFFLSHPLFFSLSPLTLTSFVFSHLIPLASTIADRHNLSPSINITGQNCAFMHNCYSNRAYIHNCYSNHAYMHSYCSICISYFSIFFLSHPLFFSLSPLTLTSFVFSHLILSIPSDSHLSFSLSTLTLRFSHLIKIKPLLLINSLIRIKPLLHEAWSNCHRSTHWFLVVSLVGFGLGGFLILGWFDLEWFADQVVMIMVVVMDWRRRGRKKILKKNKREKTERRR